MKRHELTDGTIIMATRLSRHDPRFDLLKRGGIGVRGSKVEQVKIWINGPFENAISNFGNKVEYCYQRKRAAQNRKAFELSKDGSIRVKIVDKSRDFDAGDFRVDTVYDNKVSLERIEPHFVVDTISSPSPPPPPPPVRVSVVVTRDADTKEETKVVRSRKRPRRSDDVAEPRSGLETRWLRFFDRLDGWQCTFEPRVVRLSASKCYTPDVELVNNALGRRWYVEIKPMPPDLDTLETLREVEDATGVRTLVCWGEPRAPFIRSNPFVSRKYSDETTRRYRMRRPRDSRPLYWVERGSHLIVASVDDPTRDSSWNTKRLQNAYASV